MLRAIFSKPYSQLFIVGDEADWVIDDENKNLKRTADELGIKATTVKRAPLNLPQVVHYGSQFSLLNQKIYKSRQRISLDYFHGQPDQQESFKKCFDALKQHHKEIARIRVSTKGMESLIKSSDIDPAKVMRIPIYVNTDIFTRTTPEKKILERQKLGIPSDAVVVGSFQKDGNGWGEGNEPKLIKGPDTFLKVIENLKKDIPNLWVLLSGPSRGYVKNGLKAMGVPYVHEYPKDPNKIANFYDALDLYIIASREEGGPKACLDSMAKGVPLVTTKVGQCADLVENGKNAMMAEIEDVASLTKFSLEIINNEGLRKSLINNSFITASQNNSHAQLPLWQQYFKKLIAS